MTGSGDCGVRESGRVGVKKTLMILVAGVGSHFRSAVKQMESVDGNRLKMIRDVVDATK